MRPPLLLPNINVALSKKFSTCGINEQLSSIYHGTVSAKTSYRIQSIS